MELNEHTLEQILTRQREQSQRYLDVLVESFRSDIHLVAEAASGIQEQLADLRGMVAKNTADMELMKTDLEIVKAELSIIRSDLKAKVGRDELAILEARVAKLERSGRARP